MSDKANKKAVTEVEVTEPKQELAVRAQGEVVPYSDDPILVNQDGVVFGTEDESAEDVQRLWRMKVVQQMSVESQDGTARPGQFVHPVSGEVFDSLMFLPILMKKTRVYFDKANPKSGPLCMSQDCKTGTVFGACATCQYGMWVKDPKTGKSEQPCSQVINFVGFLIHEEEDGTSTVDLLPVALSFRRTSYGAGQNMVAYRNTTGKPYFFTVFKIGAKVKTFPSGPAAVMNVRPMRAARGEEIQAAQIAAHNIASLVAKEGIDLSDEPAADVTQSATGEAELIIEDEKAPF